MKKKLSKLKSRQKRRQIFYHSSTCTVVVVCVVLFVILMKDVWNKYTAKMTSTAIRYSNEILEEKLMPCLTFYALPAYKTKGFHYSKDKFLQHTFNIDEFFDPSTLIELRNKSLFSLKENLSIFYGRGYTVCYLNKVSAKNIKFIRLKTLFDTQLFIHAKGDEFLIELSVFPTEITLITLNTQNDNEIIGVDLVISEIQTTLLYKNDFPCLNYEGRDRDFVECSRKAIWENLRPKLNCSIVGFDGFRVNGSHPVIGLNTSIGSNSDLSECQNQKAAGETFWTFLPLVKDFDGRPDDFGCPLPCQQRSYNMKMNYFHKNSWIDTDGKSGIKEDSFSLAIAFSSLIVEERVETLVYDVGSFLAAAGGNLGLFLGFSCLSVCLSLIKFLVNHFG